MEERGSEGEGGRSEGEGGREGEREGERYCLVLGRSIVPIS